MIRNQPLSFISKCETSIPLNKVIQVKIRTKTFQRFTIRKKICRSAAGGEAVGWLLEVVLLRRLLDRPPFEFIVNHLIWVNQICSQHSRLRSWIGIRETIHRPTRTSDSYVTDPCLWIYKSYKIMNRMVEVSFSQWKFRAFSGNHTGEGWSNAAIISISGWNRLGKAFVFVSGNRYKYHKNPQQTIIDKMKWLFVACFLLALLQLTSSQTAKPATVATTVEPAPYTAEYVLTDPAVINSIGSILQATKDKRAVTYFSEQSAAKAFPIITVRVGCCPWWFTITVKWWFVNGRMYGFTTSVCITGKRVC